MFSKRNMYILLTLALFYIRCVSGEDDDDDSLATDLIMGVGAALCEQFVLCRMMMMLTAMIGTIIIIVGLCSGEITCADLCNRRNARSACASGVGYGAGRALLH